MSLHKSFLAVLSLLRFTEQKIKPEKNKKTKTENLHTTQGFCEHPKHLIWGSRCTVSRWMPLEHRNVSHRICSALQCRVNPDLDQGFGTRVKSIKLHACETLKAWFGRTITRVSSAVSKALKKSRLDKVVCVCLPCKAQTDWQLVLTVSV